MKTICEARKIRNRWHRKLRNLNIKARAGKCKDAPIEIIQAMTAFNIELHNAGWRVTSEDETPPNKLVIITEEWRSQQLAKQKARKDCINRLKNGDWTALRELI